MDFGTLKLNFAPTLLKWNKAQNKRQMPWKGEKNPYFIWLSEIILQQTRVEQGLPYYQRFIKLFPTVRHLADAPQDEVMAAWQGLGYYSRARNLHSTAKHVTHELKEICKDWDRRTWEAYLIWFEGGRRDKLVKPEIYEFWGNYVHRSIFEDFGYESCPELQSFCDHLLSHLPEAQAFALRKIYLEGKTIRQAAFELNKSHTVITQNKNRALSNLIKSFPLGQLSVGRIN